MINAIPSIVCLRWLLLVSILLNCYQLSAQVKPLTPNDVRHSKKLVNRVELLAGGNFIYPKEKYDENRVEKFGYTFGLNLAHSFGNSPFDINLKLGYEQKGWNNIVYSPNTDFNPPVTQKFERSETLNYLTSSIFFSYKTKSIKNLSIGFGSYMGYLVSERMKFKLYYDDSLVSNFRGRPDPYVSYKKLDIGLMFAMTYNLKLSKIPIILRFENNHGVRDISKEINSAIKNRTYCFHVGIPINL